MKKLSLVLLTSSGVLLAACNGGGSSSANNGGTPTPSPTSTPNPPTTYSEALPNGGDLVTSSNLILASNAISVPLAFGVTGITSDTTVNFVVSAVTGSSSTQLQAGGSVPTVTPSSCSFTAVNPQPCNPVLDVANAPAGSYIITPTVNSTNLSPITFSTQAASSVLLPDGSYSSTEQSSSSCIANSVITEYFSIAYGQLCGYGKCQPNAPFPTPSGPNPFLGQGYFTNVSWTGSTLTLNWTPETCPGLLLPVVVTKINLTGLSANTGSHKYGAVNWLGAM